MEIKETYSKSDIANNVAFDKVDFCVCLEDEDTDTPSSEENYSDTESDFQLH